MLKPIPNLREIAQQKLQSVNPFHKLNMVVAGPINKSLWDNMSKLISHTTLFKRSLKLKHHERNLNRWENSLQLDNQRHRDKVKSITTHKFMKRKKSQWRWKLEKLSSQLNFRHLHHQSLNYQCLMTLKFLLP